MQSAVESSWAVKAVWLSGRAPVIWRVCDTREEARKYAKMNNAAQDEWALEGNKRYVRFVPIRILIQEVGKG